MIKYFIKLSLGLTLLANTSFGEENNQIRTIENTKDQSIVSQEILQPTQRLEELALRCNVFGFSRNKAVNTYQNLNTIETEMGHTTTFNNDSYRFRYIYRTNPLVSDIISMTFYPSDLTNALTTNRLDSKTFSYPELKSFLKSNGFLPGKKENLISDVQTFTTNLTSFNQNYFISTMLLENDDFPVVRCEARLKNSLSGNWRGIGPTIKAVSVGVSQDNNTNYQMIILNGSALIGAADTILIPNTIPSTQNGAIYLKHFKNKIQNP